MSRDKNEPSTRDLQSTYEAISSPRSYKDEKSTFDALLELLQNKEHAYDETVLKALLYTVSLYPIGTYVYLSNRKIGVVIDSNQKNPKCPIVQMLTEKEEDGSPKTVQTSQELSILRILSKKEKEDILKTFNIVSNYSYTLIKNKLIFKLKDTVYVIIQEADNDYGYKLYYIY